MMRVVASEVSSPGKMPGYFGKRRAKSVILRVQQQLRATSSHRLNPDEIVDKIAEGNIGTRRIYSNMASGCSIIRARKV